MVPYRQDFESCSGWFEAWFERVWKTLQCFGSVLRPGLPLKAVENVP